MKVLFILFFLFINSLTVFASESKNLAHCILNKYSKYVEKKYNLRTYGIGCRCAYDIKGLGPKYVSSESLELEEARKLYITIAEGFIKQFNESKELRPYLHDYPFSIKNLDLSISFENPLNCHPVGKKIAFIAPSDKGIYYDISSDGTNLIDYHYEDYSEALRLVREAEKNE